MNKNILIILILTSIFGCKTLKNNNKVNDELTKKQNHEQFLDNFSEANRSLLLDNNNKAIELFNICLELEPKSATTNFLLSKIYRDQNLLTNALFFAKQANDLDVNNLWFIENYANILHQNLEIEQGFLQYKILLSKTQDSTWFYKISDFYKQQLYFDYSLQILDLQTFTPNSFSYLNRRYQIFLLKNDTLNITQTLEKIVKFHKIQFDYMVLLCELYFTNNNFDKAKQLITEFDELYPNNDYIKYLNIKHLLLTKSFSNVNNLIFELIKLENIDFEKKYELLKIYEKSEFFTSIEKENLYLALLNRHETESNLLTSFALFYESENKINEAITIWETLIKNAKFDDKNLLHLSDFYINKNDFSSLKTISLQAIEVYPNQPIFYLNAGIAYYNLTDFKNAIKYLKSGKNLIIDNTELDQKFTEYLNKIY